MRGAAVIAVIAALAGDAAARTIYVAPGGSDKNDGSSKSPYETLEHAARVVKPGDTVIARPGLYQGFDVRKRGTLTAPIVFRAEEGATIDRESPRTRRDGINVENASYVRIEGFIVKGVKRAGIRAARCDHVEIVDNKVDGNGRWGIFTGFCEDLLIEGNEASRSDREHGIYVSNSADRPVVRRNLVWGNNKAGIQLNGDANQGGDGVISDALVEVNVIYKNGARGASAINCDGVQRSTFRNNLLFDNQASGISLYRINGGGPSSGNLVVNNTIIVGDKGRWALNIQNGSSGNRVFNNILLNRHRYRGSVNISPDSLPGYQADYNVVMDRFTLDDGDSRLTLAQWRARSGQDKHSIVAGIDELFADQKEFKLKPGSPAVDAGKAMASKLGDRFGVSRPVGAGVDIGAHELCPGDACATRGKPPVEPSVPVEEVPAASGDRKPGRKSGCQSCGAAGGGGGGLALVLVLVVLAVRRRR